MRNSVIACVAAKQPFFVVVYIKTKYETINQAVTTGGRKSYEVMSPIFKMVCLGASKHNDACL